MKYLIIIALNITLIPSCVFAQSDSLRNHENRINVLEQSQKNKEDALENKFVKLEQDLSWKLDLAKWFSFAGIGFTLIGLVTIWQKGQKYINGKINSKFDRIISDKESDIIAIVNKHDQEKQLVLKKKIVVITAQNGNEDFARKFFKAMRFPIDNVTYKKVASYEDFGKFDLIFANNEKGDFDLKTIHEYFSNSSANTALFYFNETKQNYIPSGNEAERLNFANSKLQIFGNLINLLRYQDVLKA